MNLICHTEPASNASRVEGPEFILSEVEERSDP